MIGKIARFGSNFLGAIQYVYFGTKVNRTRDLTTVRGELIFAQQVGIMLVPDRRLKNDLTHRLNVGELANAMQATAALNGRLRKPVWHQSFAFPPGEQPTEATLSAICEAFVGMFGLARNQVLAFRHRDKQHDHIHIIANRVDHTGRTTALDSFNYRRTAEFCRLMEVRHNLMPTPHLIGEQLDGKRRAASMPADDAAARTYSERDQLRAAIQAARQEATDLPTFVEQLRQRGYVAITSERTDSGGKRRAGIAYGKTFAGGTERWVSGSALGPDYTHRGLSTFFAQQQADLTRAADTLAELPDPANMMEHKPDKARLRVN